MDRPFRCCLEILNQPIALTMFKELVDFHMVRRLREQKMMHWSRGVYASTMPLPDLEDMGDEEQWVLQKMLVDAYGQGHEERYTIANRQACESYLKTEDWLIQRRFTEGNSWIFDSINQEGADACLILLHCAFQEGCRGIENQFINLMRCFLVAHQRIGLAFCLSLFLLREDRDDHLVRHHLVLEAFNVAMEKLGYVGSRCDREREYCSCKSGQHNQ